ncbi:hypothetical protein [Empedobacter sp.]|uniref:hypothetical protein n=1 Tax=Empedobacter sp. TaxID=1927715 RepID=UPI0028975841|nr:hypothetical protein [Empedobacter sp.]
MKKHFTLFLLFTSILSFAQKLTLNELLSLRKKGVAEVDEYLTAKKWKFLEAEEPTDETLGLISYDYKKNYYDNNAESFIKYYYSGYSDNTRRIMIQVHNNSVLNTYVNQIKAWGGKLYNSYVDDGDIIKIYRGSTMTYKVITSTQNNSFGGTQSIYMLIIYTNEDFDY